MLLYCTVISYIDHVARVDISRGISHSKSLERNLGTPYARLNIPVFGKLFYLNISI